MEENTSQDNAKNSSEPKEKIVQRIIEEEMQQSYIDYAMSVIVSRALPDVRDGLKPVHRRVLYTMWETGILHNKPFKKSANVVGNCMARYHPHGDSAIYDTLVRLTQPFSLRHPLVEGQGNFGCFTKDTKVKLTDGRDLSFEDLIDEHKQGKKNFTYTINSEGTIGIAEIKNPRLTKTKQKIIKIVLDNNEEIKCTLDHRFMLRNGKYKQANDLQIVDSLMPVNLETEELETFNHKVQEKELLLQPEDVYDLTIDGTHNFALAAGIFVHNSIDGDSPAAMRYCISGDSLILSDKGIIPIKSISNRKEAKININIVSHDGKKNSASKFFDSGKHNTIEIETTLGYKIRGSYNHPLLCWVLKNNIPQMQWKLLENIKKWEVVVLSRDSQLFSKKPLTLNEYFPKSGFKNDVGLPGEMTNSLAFLLGAFVSEGSIHNNQFLFRNKDKVFYSKVKSALLSEFKNIQLYERKIKGGCTELSVYEQRVVLFLKNIGLSDQPSIKKEIPFSVLMSTKDNIKNFLTALFEGDGSVIAKTDKRHGGKCIELTYNSKSSKLIEQLKVVLLNFGIATTNPYTDKRNGCFKLIISGSESIKRFQEEINFFSKRKCMALATIHSLNSQRMSKTDFIPYLNDYLRKKYQSWVLQKYNFDRYNNLEKNYKKLIGIIDPKDKDMIDLILKQGYLFNEVATAKRINKKENVYSVRVDSNCHSFVANGFINHNTEARLNKLAEELLEDIDKNTVKFVPNFDNSLEEPSVLPSKFPNLLVNGSSGIAVGMATNIPPHNAGEVIDAIIEQIKNPDITIEELMRYIKGPDFPTAGIICGRNEILNMYKTGRGKILVRAKTFSEEKNGRERVIVSSIPYMVNKAELITQIADLVRDKKITGISDLRDESDREGMRIVIEIKKDANSTVVLNQLYKHTRLQTTFGVIMIALVDSEPKTLNLKQIIHHYIYYRRYVVRKRTEFDLEQNKKRAHILEGIIVALDNIDEVIALIKKSKSIEDARLALTSSFKLSVEQAQAILDTKLQRLTTLEREKINKEHDELLRVIAELSSILASEQKILDIIKKELLELKDKYADDRRTEINDEMVNLDLEKLIKEEDVVITVTHSGYLKRQAMDLYKQQRRGGHGIIATGVKEEDAVEHLFIANTHSYILFFTNKGKVHWLKVYNIPEGGRQTLGKAIVNLVDLEKDEKITAFVPVKEFDDRHYLVMATKKGTIKKTILSAYSNPRKGGIIGITLDPNDELVNVVLTDGKQELTLATKEGLAVRCEEQDVRPTGRSAMGVKGATLNENDEVVAMIIAQPNQTILTITENGYGKRTDVSEYRLITRGGKGVINIMCSERNGKVVSVKSVSDNDELMLISKNGIIIRVTAKDISVIGRNTQGVRLMKLDPNDKVVAAAKIVKEENNKDLNNEPASK